MEQLNPDELFLIFRHLDVVSLRKCRLVNKKFRSSCDKFKVTKVIACDAIRKSKEIWFQTGDQIDFLEAIKIDAFRSSKNLFRIDQTLERLYLGACWRKEFDFQFINEFTALKQLGIEFNVENNFTSDQVLDLPNLQILQLLKLIYYPLERAKYKFKLKNSTKFLALKCENDSFDYLEVNDPKTVRHLSIGQYSERVDLFVNLNFFQCDEIQNGALLNQDILQSLKNLKRLDLNFVHLPYSDLNVITKTLNYIRNQKRILRRITLAIYVNGVYFECNLQLVKTDIEYFSFQLRNYELLEGDLSFVRTIRFGNLLRKLIKNDLLITRDEKTSFPPNFFKKYFNIRTLEVCSPVSDVNMIHQILKNSSNLTELHLSKSSLNQTFLDHLPDYCELTTLRIIETQPESIDFSFILKFKLLKFFYTNQEISSDLAIKSLKKFEHFALFQFKCRLFKVAVRTRFDGAFEIEIFRQSSPESSIVISGSNLNKTVAQLYEILLDLKENKFDKSKIIANHRIIELF